MIGFLVPREAVSGTGVETNNISCCKEEKKETHVQLEQEQESGLSNS
jgi:hypothetical protein